MNTTDLKTYAPQARRDFIAAVTARAAIIGLTAKRIEPITEQGDVALIGDKAFPRSVAGMRKNLEDRIQQQGFDQVMEAMAYTWFNRFMAIRYMELHGYLDHGRRVLSHPEKKIGFEILDDCAEIDLPGVDRDEVVELKLAGNKDEELYRLLLLGQCHALHEAMPFLFEAIDDETELLLPDNLTKTDSLIRHLVDDIPEESWDNIEIIGWLYQFYISEKKDQVIGKVVKSEDIPAATQLFTPNWIVKYMVQNSLGAQWLATYPDSTLKGQMEYYIEPAEQTEEVNQQLKAITPTSLDPEKLTLIDPASGSGHILTEAYELFKAIYLERGYRQRAIPQLILEKNLFGLDIDERAAQLTGFALMMKGRADDRRLFERQIKLNVMALQDSASFDAERVIDGIKLVNYDLQPKHLTGIGELFENATTFGSLIQVPEELAEKLPELKQLSSAISQDLFVADALKRLGPLAQQAELLAAQYDAVVANPPYMGSGGMNVLVKKLAKDHYADAKSDLFACFIERGFALAKDLGRNSMVTMESWMFLSSYEKFRGNVLRRHTLRNLAHFPYDGKRPTAMGINFGVAVICAQDTHVAGYQGHYCCSRYYELNDDGVPFEFPTPNERLKIVAAEEFEKIPGSPVAYWVSEQVRSVFERSPRLAETCKALTGMRTGDNERFLREWHELPFDSLGIRHSREEAKTSSHKWFPYNKGGDFQKWFGNNGLMVNWANDGEEIKHLTRERYPQLGENLGWKITNEEHYFRDGITWGGLTSAIVTFRYSNIGALFDSNKGAMMFPSGNEGPAVIGFLSSPLVSYLLNVLNPSMSTQNRDVDNLPYWPSAIRSSKSKIDQVVEGCIRFAIHDEAIGERSWDFQSLPLRTVSTDSTPTLESSYTAWITQNRDTIAEMQRLEEENNRLFIDAYGLRDELTPDVPIEQITLTVNPAYRYGGKLTEEEQWNRFQQDTMEELVSYAIGCMMGRYSLDAPGLIYARSGNEGFDPSRYPTFPADDDGIVPLTDTDWFEDDACNRLIEFVSVAWDESQLETNLSFLADNLSPKKNESSRETLRRYLCDKFFKDHLQTYKKRPIYWLFSSGKQKAFQCLVYLHRNNEGTLARMRTEYVIPLQGRMSSRIEQLDSDIGAAGSTAHRKKLERERDKLAKQQVELQDFDEKLRYYADQRIHLDLDDGVKVNYGKFGDLLAEVKAITGKKPE